MVLRYLIEKEFKQISRNRIFVILILWFPIITLVLLPWAVNFEVRDVRVAIFDESRGHFSQHFVQKIKASDSFIPVADLRSYEQGMELVEAQEVDMVIHIPRTFDRDLSLNRSPEIFLAALAVDATQALLATNYITSITHQFCEQLRAENPSPDYRPLPLTIVTDYRFNPSLDFKTNMLPAFIVILITLVCGMLPALNIVQEKENGTIQQMNVTPVTKMQFIFSKVIPYWIIGVIILVMSVLLVRFVYNLWPISNIGIVFLVSIIFIVNITGFGIIVSNYSNTLQQAMLVMLFCILIFLLMSGLFSPVDAMPVWAQTIAYINPLTHYIEALRLLYLKGISLAEVSSPILILCCFAVLINSVAVLSYKKSR